MVLIPTYNEAPEVLSATVASIAAAGYPLVLIDDGSAVPVAGEALTGQPPVLRHCVNLGQGAALQTGFSYALAQGAPWCVTFDADGQHHADSIAALLQPILAGEADISLGSRFLRPEHASQVPSAKRRLLRAARTANGLLTGLWMSDAHNGLRALNRFALQSIQLKEARMAHATELLWQIKAHGLRWREVPVPVDYTPYSKAKGQPMSASLSIIRDLLLRRLFP